MEEKKEKEMEKRMGITLSADPKEISKLNTKELEDRFQKKVIPEILKRLNQFRDNDPWYQWSYAFF
jgi:hypothetical protein